MSTATQQLRMPVTKICSKNSFCPFIFLKDTTRFVVCLPARFFFFILRLLRQTRNVPGWRKRPDKYLLFGFCGALFIPRHLIDQQCGKNGDSLLSQRFFFFSLLKSFFFFFFLAMCEDVWMHRRVPFEAAIKSYKKSIPPGGRQQQRTMGIWGSLRFFFLLLYKRILYVYDTDLSSLLISNVKWWPWISGTTTTSRFFF